MKFPVLAGLAASLIALSAFAQQWPQKPVKIVVPYAAGGNTDSLARLASERLSALGQQFVIEHRTGAAGLIAAEYVARAPADGYTLFMATLTQIVTAPFTNRINFDPTRDFVPISIIGTNPFIIAVSASVPVNDLPEFVSYTKARPGQLNFASAGYGGLTYLSGALFLQRAGLEVVNVSYKGGAPALIDLLSGQVQMYSGSPSEILPHAKSNRIRLLGVSSEKRMKQLPDVPAIAEFYPGHGAVTWNGLVAPAGTPSAVIMRVSQEIQKAMRDPQFVSQLEQIGVDPVLHTPEEFATAIRREIEQWGALIKAAGIKPE
jgi:tripartite-type tricarboxylate transporter receptor subunit TctC